MAHCLTLAKILILALAYFMMILPYLLTLVSFLSINSVACWMPLGDSNFPHGMMEGSVVDLSHDGLRLAVGSPSQDNGDGRISVYELDASGVNWQLLVEITGMPDEGLGDALSISPDGLLVAARRHHVTPNAVQVFQILESQPFVFHYDLLGPLVYCPVDGNGTEVQLGQTSLDPVSEYVLLLSCEDFESQRGMVQAYVLDRGTFFYSNESLQWRPYLPPLTGDRPGDRFGHATALVHAPHTPSPSGTTLRVAVASPYHDWKRGSVQVFVAEESGWTQLGQRLVGFEQGDQFGFSLDMSSTTGAYLAVGSPKAQIESQFISQGTVQVFHWRIVDFGKAPTWHILSVLRPHGDFIGGAVAMSRDGQRIATGSIHYGSGRGYVVLYEMDSYNSIRGSGPPLFGSEQGDNFGASLAMNAQGSLLAISGHRSSEGNGKTSVWIDPSPFCQVQPFANNAVRESVLDSYLSRRVCRAGTTMIDDSENCESIILFLEGQWSSCIWEDSNLAQVLDLDESPSVAPHDFLNETTISIAPSSGPFLYTGNATIAPSHQSTSAPWSEVPTNPPRENSSVASPEMDPISEKEEISSPSPTANPFVRVCRCDDREYCISEPLPQALDLHLCLRVLSRGFDLLSLLRMDLSQPDYLVVMIDENFPMTDHSLSQTCQGSLCSVTVEVPAVFYGEGRPSTMTITGRATVIQKPPRKLPGLEDLVNTTIAFDLNVKLALDRKRNKNDPVLGNGHAASTNEERKGKLFVALGVFLGALALLGMFAFETNAARKQSLAN
jgi:hypothetical protein